MTSLRKQILDRVEEKLEAVKADLEWKSLICNPREEVAEDQWNAIVMMHGGDVTPQNLTGHVEIRWLEFSVGWLAKETEGESAEALIDKAYVAIHDALLDPNDIQLGELAVGIELDGISDPMIGKSKSGARIIGAQSMDFRVQYMAQEGNASVAGP